MKKFLQKNWEIILLGLILLLGAYLRLYRISDYMTFLGDEGRDVLVVKRMIVDHKFTLLGPNASVGGFFLGPIYYYFMLPFLWLWRLDPSGPAVMVALFGLATIYLVYRMGRDFFHPLVGLIASSLYAISPIIIAYSRSSWNPNLVPFFAAFLIYLLWRSVAFRRWSNLFWVGTFFGIGLQLHYLFLFLIPVAGMWLLLYGRQTSLIKYYVLGFLGFLVGYSPFLAFEARHGFPNTQSIMRFIFEGKDTGYVGGGFMGRISDIIFRLFGRLVFRAPQSEIWYKLSPWQITSWQVGTWLVILSVLGLLVFILFDRSQKILKQLADAGSDKLLLKAKYQAWVLLVIWLVIPVVLFGFYKKAVYDYYLGILFVLPFLLTGGFFTCLYLWRRVPLRWAAVVIWGFLLMLNWQGRPFIYPPNRQLLQVKQIAAAALSKAEGKPFNFALVADFNSDHAYRYFFEVWGNKPVTIENAVNDPGRHTVTDQLIVICEKTDCKPLGHPLWEIAGFGRAQISGQWDVSFVKIFKLVHYQSPKDKK